VNLPLLAWLVAHALPLPGPAKPLSDVMRTARVSEEAYRLIMFRTDHDSASGFSLVHRVIERVTSNGRRTIRVREANRAKNNFVTVYAEANSLRPLFYESKSGDSLTVMATVDGDSLRLTETLHGETTSTVTAAPRGAYFSNCFSELIQANDFGVNPSITFMTFTPGGPTNTFTVERVGRRTFSDESDVWVLRFSRTDAAGATVPAGYRYVDVRTGKVLFFATELDSPSTFSYQVLPLH
jgi:hypothetical protein